MQNYINLTRINRPTGIFLLLLPCLFSLFFQFSGQIAQNLPEILKFSLFFTLGSIFMRSAGCIINDIFDQKFDRQVARTKNRPLASGALKTHQALILLAILLCLSLLILLQFSPKAIFSGIFALFLVILYPLMKRITFYPQIFLGITFNFGIIIAALQFSSQISPATALLYLSCIIWTLIYDTIYAFQDIQDDLKIGIKSSAIAFAKNPRKILIFLTFLQFFCLFCAGFLQNLPKTFFFISFLAFFQQFYLVKLLDVKNPENCLEVFKKTVNVGGFILLAVVF